MIIKCDKLILGYKKYFTGEYVKTLPNGEREKVYVYDIPPGRLNLLLKKGKRA